MNIITVKKNMTKDEIIVKKIWAFIRKYAANVRRKNVMNVPAKIRNISYH